MNSTQRGSCLKNDKEWTKTQKKEIKFVANIKIKKIIFFSMASVQNR